MTANYSVVNWCDVMIQCKNCSSLLEKDEIALTKKLMNRGATQFYCFHCLAAHFEVSVPDLKQKVLEFKQMGCTLFF